MANVKSNCSEILSGLKIYHDAGDTFEIRIPDAGSARTISGYFTDFAKAAKEIGYYTKGGAAIYVTINPVDPRLIGRSNNCLKVHAKNTTADKDIVRLNWLPVDGDPPRPAGISATDIEHYASISMIKNMRNWLISAQGWPENAFVIVDSGNGGYLLCRIELEKNKENSNLVKKCLEALDYLYSDETFHVDTTSSNPARILRVPGTTNAKGDEVGEMKHRLAWVLGSTEEIRGCVQGTLRGAGSHATCAGDSAQEPCRRYKRGLRSGGVLSSTCPAGTSYQDLQRWNTGRTG